MPKKLYPNWMTSMPDKTTKTTKRKKIPLDTKQFVLLESGYKCANPSCRHILTLELHHIIWVKDGGGNKPENLLSLCPNCHSLHTAGHIPESAIRAWKSLLVSLNNPNRASADLLLVLYDDEKRIKTSGEDDKHPPPFRFTGDGLIMLSSLLVSGLVEISRRYSGAAYFGGGMPSFEVRLTATGRRLVAAWLSGQPEAVESVLANNKEK
jgi:hypothetical protein